MDGFIEELRLDRFAVRQMRSYGKYVVEHRALPDYRDGLKPVQRRILWAMHLIGLRYNTGYKKTARVVGDVISKLNPHGDCLGGDTEVFLLSGKREKISDLVGKGSKWVLALDPKTNNLVPAIAHSWRVGKVTNKKYRIHLSNDSVIEVTGNHPFYVKNKFVETKNLNVLDCFYTFNLKMSGNYFHIKKASLHSIVGNYLNTKPSSEEIWHHKNEITTDNRPSNLTILTRTEHALHHEDYLDGLEKGRKTMFAKKGEYRKAIKKKNSLMIKAYNENQGLYKAIKIVQNICESNVKITPENYEKERLNMYNGPKLSTIEMKGYSLNELKSLIGYKLDISHAVGLTEHLKTKKEDTSSITEAQTGKVLSSAAKVIKKMCSKYSIEELNWANYEKTRAKMCKKVKGKYFIFNRAFPKQDTLENYGVISFDDLIKQTSKYVIFISKIEIIKCDEEKMYDFTVDKYENMAIPTSKGSNQFIIAHNSSAHGAMVTMVNAPLALIDGSGGWGWLNTQPAAYRYSECRLSKYADETMFSKPHIEISDMVLNYDGSEQEPIILPALLPNLLLNGVQGQAVGVVTGVPPFKLKGVTKIIEMALTEKNITPNTLNKHLELNYRYGGVIVDPERLRIFMETGESAIMIQSNYVFDQEKSTILITDCGPNFEAQWAQQKLYEFDIVTKIDDHTSDKNGGLKIIVHIRKNDEAHAQVPILMRKLADSLTLRFNLTNRISNEDATFFSTTPVEYIKKWCDWRKKLETKAQLQIAANLDKKISQNELLILAANNLDLIVKELKRKEDRLPERIADKLKISVDDAKYLAARSISSYAALNTAKLIEDKKLYLADSKKAKSIAASPTEEVINITKKLALQF